MNALILSVLLFGGPQQDAVKPTFKRMTANLGHDITQELVYVEAEITLREGPLELFLCPKRTKEHESILAADIDPYQFNVAMLIVGAEPGEPVRFEPNYMPARGQPVKIWVQIDDADGKRRLIDAREWIQDAKTKKALPAQFIYTGSRFVQLPGKDRAEWLGYGGDLICISNFPGSVIDVAMRSSDKNAELMFMAWTERILDRTKKVRVIVEPLHAE